MDEHKVRPHLQLATFSIPFQQLYKGSFQMAPGTRLFISRIPSHSEIRTRCQQTTTARSLCSVRFIMPKHTDTTPASERIVALEKEIEELEKSEGLVMNNISLPVVELESWGIFALRSFEDAEKRVNRHHRMLHQYNEAKASVKLMSL